jgi:hypothetical protein
MTILAATAWPTNGHLIADVFGLYRYMIGEDPDVLDPTYGKGNWWTIHRPTRLTAPVRADGWDFTAMPGEWTNRFDVVAYDPPYVSVGGRKTTGIADMHDAYGLTDAPATPALLQALINDGLNECTRVTRPGGLILVKCQDYISSGKLWIGTHHTLTHALSLGLELVDRLEHHGGVRPQPTGRRVMHARRNLSTLFVLGVNATPKAPVIDGQLDLLDGAA